MAQPISHLRPVPDGGEVSHRPADAGEWLNENLVQRARSGEISAWSRLYQDNFTRLYRHVRLLTGDRHVSEEVVQDTFVQAMLQISSFNSRSQFSTWLHGIAINIVRNHWRSRQRTVRAHARLTVVRALEAGGEEAEGALHRKQRVRALYAALDTLPEHLRLAFVLRDLEGLSPEVAAAQLDISANNLAVRATRGRQQIRKQLVEWGVLPPEGGRQ